MSYSSKTRARSYPMLWPTMTLGCEVSPKGTRCWSFSDSPRSQGDNQAYHVSGLAAQAMTANELSFHITSVSKVNIASLGACTGSVVPSELYFVQPLLLIQLRGFGGRSILAYVFAL